MAANEAIALPVFTAVSGLTLLILLLLAGRRTRIDTRLDAVSSKGRAGADYPSLTEFARTALPKLAAPLMPDDKEERSRLQTRLIHAGFYGRQALLLFLGAKMALLLTPACIGLILGMLGIVPIRNGLIFGVLFSILGMIGPSFWLDHRKGVRQISFRRALPDALDVLVICLEAGLSLPVHCVVWPASSSRPILSSPVN